MFGLAGAMVPGGMRRVIVYLIENRLIDVLVSTGANLFHDVYETLGKPHFQGSPESDDHELGRRRINRFYDVLAPESDFSAAEEFVTQLSLHPGPRLIPTPRASTSALVGDALMPVAQEEGILTAAVRARRARLLARPRRQRPRPGHRLRPRPQRARSGQPQRSRPSSSTSSATSWRRRTSPPPRPRPASSTSAAARRRTSSSRRRSAATSSSASFPATSTPSRSRWTSRSGADSPAAPSRRRSRGGRSRRTPRW